MDVYKLLRIKAGTMPVRQALYQVSYILSHPPLPQQKDLLSSLDWHQTHNPTSSATIYYGF